MVAAEFTRRALLGTLSASAMLSACSDTDDPLPPSPTPTSTESAAIPLDSPFGLTAPSQVAVSIFDGGYGTDYAQDVADAMQDRLPGVTVSITPLERMNELDLTASPPDVIHNSGAGALAIGTVLEQLEALDDLIDAPSLEGTPLRETLHSTALAPGIFDGNLVAINYVLTVYGLWYSASLFESRGWSPPSTWDAMLSLGALAKKEDRYLFAWSPEAATYYLELVISSAIKEGGDQVRIALDGLTAGAWQHPVVTHTLAQLEECVRQGYFQPADPELGYLETQATWSMQSRSLFYPAGAWIEREMLDNTAEGFRMTCSAVPTLTSSPTLPPSAIHASAAEPFVVPTAANNVAGGKEFLRTMLSHDAAAQFAVTNLVPTVVKNTVPATTESTSLGAQTRLLAEAGEYVFAWRFVSHYGLEEPFGALMSEFLRGNITTDDLVTELQRHTDEIRNNPDIELYTVE